MKNKIFYSASLLLIIGTIASTVYSYIEEEKRITSQPGYSGVDMLSLTVYPILFIMLLTIELLVLLDVKFFIGLSEKRTTTAYIVRSVLLTVTLLIVLISTRGLNGQYMVLGEILLLILFGTSIFGRILYVFLLQRQKNGKHR